MQRVLAPEAPAGTVNPDDLCISAGCGAILDNLFMTITSPGDGVLIPAPYYPAFDNDLRVRNGARALPVSGDRADTLPNPSQLDAAVAKAAAEGCRVRALLLTNPSNPLGVVFTPAELTAAMEWAFDKGLHVVVDEVYASSVFDAQPAVPFVSALAMEAALPAMAKNKLHLVYGLSKDFCASGGALSLPLFRPFTLQPARAHANRRNKSCIRRGRADVDPASGISCWGVTDTQRGHHSRNG